MFLARLARMALILIVFITAYLPITINPKILKEIRGDNVSYITRVDKDNRISHFPT